MIKFDLKKIIKQPNKTITTFTTIFIVCGCASGEYIPPSDGKTTTLEFKFSSFERKVVIYDKHENCAGWKSASTTTPAEQNVKVQVKQGEKVSFSVSFVASRNYGSFKSCAQTFTLDATYKNYIFNYDVKNGECSFTGYGIENENKYKPSMRERTYIQPFMDSLSAPHCEL